MVKKIVIIGTLDTKGEEVKYIKEQIVRRGKKVIVIDSGIRGTPIGVTKPEITREMVAKAAGSTIEKLAKEYRGPAVEVMMRGVEKVVRDLYAAGEVDGVISVGGAEGSLLGCAGMKALPIGVPKLMVSAVASGNATFGPYVGTKDVTVMHSVVDILGLNEISNKIFDNAVAAIVGMVDAEVGTQIRGKNLVAATMYGNTTPLVMKAKPIVEEGGYEVVVLHPYATGGRNVEELIEQGVFVGVLDVTLHNITEGLLGGVAHPPGEAAHRLEAAAKKGIPQVVVPGCVDLVILGPPETVPAKFKDRKFYQHNPLLTIVRTSKEEMWKLGKIIADKLNKATGPTVVAFPMHGISMYNKEGLALYDPEADAALLESLKKHLHPKIRLEEVEAHINDDAFAKVCASLLLEVLKGKPQGG